MLALRRFSQRRLPPFTGSFKGKRDGVVLRELVDRLRLLEAEARASGRQSGKRGQLLLIITTFFAVGIVSYTAICQPHAHAIFYVPNGTQACAPGHPDGYSALDSLYVTMMIITTIGLGDLHPVAQAATNWTIPFAFFGLAVLAYALSGVIEGDAQKKHRSMRSRRIALLERYGADAATKIKQEAEMASSHRWHSDTDLNHSGESRSARDIDLSLEEGVAHRDAMLSLVDPSAALENEIASAGLEELDRQRRVLPRRPPTVLMLDLPKKPTPVPSTNPFATRRDVAAFAPHALRHSVESAMELVKERMAESRKLGLWILLLVVVHFSIMAGWALIFSIYVGWSFVSSLYFVWTVATTVGFGDYGHFTCVVEEEGFACRTPDVDDFAQVLVLIYIVTALALTSMIFRHAADLINEGAALAAATLHVAEAFALQRIETAQVRLFVCLFDYCALSLSLSSFSRKMICSRCTKMALIIMLHIFV
tara:strand:+ start:127 stop:1566 length:1440 start_codon:yes stop_codon:yes gene_type:complete